MTPTTMGWGQEPALGIDATATRCGLTKSHIPTIEGARRDHYQSAMGFKLYYQMLQDNSQHGPNFFDPARIIRLPRWLYSYSKTCIHIRLVIFYGYGKSQFIVDFAMKNGDFP
jgi:hypothetical protein